MKDNKKSILSEERNPTVHCPRGHTYRVPFRFFRRNVRRKRDFRCPTCLTAFKVKGVGY
jgi:hypothetical protein